MTRSPPGSSPYSNQDWHGTPALFHDQARHPSGAFCAMIDQNGQPVTKPALKTYLAIYNAGVRGSKEFGALPRALITICDNLALGKTTYVKCVEGQVQLSRRKDGSVTGNGL